MMIYTITEIQDKFQLTGNALNKIPSDSPLRDMYFTLHISTDPKILHFLMSLQGIRCVIQYGLAQVFWDDKALCFGVCYSNGDVAEAFHSKDVKRIITEAERHKSYGNLGHDSEFHLGEGKDHHTEWKRDQHPNSH